MFKIQVTGAQDLKRLSRQLREAGNPKQVRRDLTKGLRAGAKPAVVAVKAAALALPDKPGNASPGLRKELAAATSIQVRTAGNSAGVRVRISRARMGDRAALAKVTNKGRWRHPVYGNRSAWVTQTSRRGWFDAATRSAAPAVRRSLKKVLDDIERKLKHH